MPVTYHFNDEIHSPFGYGRRRFGLIFAVITSAALGLILLMAYLMNMESLEMAAAAAAATILSILCLVRVRWVLYAFIFVCLFSPEIPLTEHLSRTAKRPITLRVEDILLVVLVLHWLARTAVDKRLGLSLRTPLNKPILAYVIICALASAAGIGLGWVQGVDRLGAILFVLKYIQYFVIFFIVINLTDSEQMLRHMIIAAVITYVAVCAFGIAQIPGGIRPSAFAEYHGEPNTLAGYLVLMLGVVGGLLMTSRRPNEVLLWSSLVLIGLVLLAYTLSRAGWMGLIGVVLVLTLWGRHKLAVLGTLLAVAIVMIMVSFSVSWLPEPIETRVRETAGEFEPLSWDPPVEFLGYRFDPSASERLRSYGKALNLWIQRAETHWLPVATGSGVLGGGVFVDGQYIRVLIETGLLGLTAFLVLIAVMWRRARTAYQTLRVPWHRGFALGYLAGLCGLMFHALAANSFIIVRIMEPFFILTALLFRLPDLEKSESDRSAEEV